MISLENIDFDADATFECGQCFRWNADNGVYTGIVDGKVCRVDGNKVLCPDGDNAFWKDYFCVDTDYSEVKKRLLKVDPKLAPCIEYGGGIRLLRQPLWETAVSFIISANNNIPRIRKIISGLCESFGDKLEACGNVYYSFPSPQRLAGLDLSDLSHLKAGYRDKYILSAAKYFADGNINAEELSQMPTAEVKKKLTEIKGVGSKVADCIMLFSLGRYEVFPQDVWIKRIMSEVYGTDERSTSEFVSKLYGGLGGYAQQYLYYYYRDNS